MKLKQIALIALVVVIGACGKGKRDPLKDLNPTKGKPYHGGTFSYNEVENFRSLYPLNITEVAGYRIVSQVYEGLLRLSQRDLSLQPALAERWEVDSTATVYTFYLRKGVRFQDNKCFKDGKGREVTAKDFKASLDRLCDSRGINQAFWVFKNRVVGATEYYNSTAKENANPLAEGVSGVEVLDDYTIRITLIKPFASFAYIMALPYTAVVPHEAIETYDADMRSICVGTGPFIVKEVKENEVVSLIRNPNYWDKDELGNQLPYLNAIKVSFVKERKTELLEFRKGKFDMVYKLPLEMVTEVIDKNDMLTKEYEQYVIQKTPSLTLQYYGFQHKNKLFQNKALRRAFNYAIDRQKIVDFTLKGMAIAANFGVVPPALVGYDTKAIKGYTFDPDKAKKYLAEAGYPNGEGLPEIILQLNSGGGRNIQVAEAVQKMIEENLNITVKMSVMPFPQHLENLETGKAMFWRSGWIADYPDPENFLNLFYGPHVPEELSTKSYINSVRYQDAEYDSYFETALKILDEDERNKAYLKADQKVIDDAAIIPLAYDKDIRLLQPYVRNFFQNPMEYRNLRDVYFSPDPEEDENEVYEEDF